MVTSSLTAATFLRGYMKFLRQQGWDVTVICAPGPGVAEMAQADGVSLHTLEMRRDPALLRDLVSLGRTAILLRKLRPDVVVYATPKASLLGAIGGAMAGITVRVYEQWGLRLETLSGFRRFILAGVERLTAKLSTTIVANSRSLSDRLRTLKLSGGRDVVVLGDGSAHGVDTTHFSSDVETAGLDRDTRTFVTAHENMLRICFVGRLHPDKGIETLLEGMSAAGRAGVRVAAILVGPSEGAEKNIGVHTRYSQLNLRLVGEVVDTRPYLDASDVLVLMSRREGFPTVVLEAASMGIPAIVANSTGTVDSVVDGVTGIVVPVGDSQMLADALATLANDRQLLSAYGMAARQRAIDRFDQTHVWRMHSEYFLELLERSRR
ncbi:hypothetical protein GCM10007198_03600 [Microbacterium aerolatum]|uniref:Glycosyltransferase subfamily 4-like N-terminal domain-containing protein n=2 Tax=Microbacterium aerolatum TaxID=153731 RepID=A0A511ADM7_9MICO|nr:hypothetical protein MAE01_14060 [Microbacterium aerolatum]GGB16295.1 hypothetical protein GCM10007198_03600 [Microbacterium aerolatum]